MSNTEVNLTPEMLQDMFRCMVTIRHFEEAAVEDYAAGKIGGALHSCAGQEAIAVGVCANLAKSDQIISTHRGHGHCIAKGADIKRMFAELYGRRDGYCKGKGGSMHIADFSIGMLGANGIVGGGFSIVTGAGLAAKMDGKGAVAVSFFGDGASNAGPFHECLNIAAVWNLPMIYVCEHNLYAANTRSAVTHARESILPRAEAYGIPAVSIDGNDVFAVHKAAWEAVARARQGQGPSLIECRTYRQRPHSERKSIVDMRLQDEVEAWKKRDPIDAFRNFLIDQGHLTEAGFLELEAEIAKEIADAQAFADASPYPLHEEALEDVYAA